MRARTAIAIFALMASTLPFSGFVPETAAATADTNQTIVLVRHAEKPPSGLGQLNCQGLNRALALPAVLQKTFGKPVAIFAANPAEQKTDSGTLYDYVRPLATIEPTAIALGMPINAQIGQSRIDDLRRQLDQPMYQDAYVLVAWEHTQATLLARALLKAHGGDPAQVPDWNGTDFDSIYVVRIRRSGTATTASFEVRHEGLDGQSTTCPGGAR